MILRLFVENFLSFREPVEINAFPHSARYAKHGHHTYKVKGVDALKILSVYGANASGKSNLIKALIFLVDLVREEKIPETSAPVQFALTDDTLNKPAKIALEFSNGFDVYIYGVEVLGNVLLNEELYRSGLGKKEDELIFSRTSDGKSVEVKFADVFYEEEKNRVLVAVLQDSILKPDRPILKYLPSLNNPYFSDLDQIMHWVKHALLIIRPKERTNGLAYLMYEDKSLHSFANDVVRSYHVGVEKIVVERMAAEKFFGFDDRSKLSTLRSELENTDEKSIQFISAAGDEINVIEEEGELVTLRVRLHHYNRNDTTTGYQFSMDQESDGTNRLLDFIPAFYIALKYSTVVCIDEIGQSIHPMLIKELLAKFSADENTKGQIIFTTHESNLLDQEILRRDEIWFAEKNKFGESSVYPLSTFKEHNTKNLRKGYLNGRYGAVPFLGNLKDLNWHANDPVPEPHL